MNSNIKRALEERGHLNIAQDQFLKELTIDSFRFQKSCSEANEYLREANISFETTPLNIIGIPYLFSAEFLEKIEEQFAQLHQIIERIPDLYAASKEVRKFFRLPENFEPFIGLDCHVKPNVHLCRYDFSLDENGTPRIYELNSAAPAGLSFSPYFYQAYVNNFFSRLLPLELGDVKLGPFKHQTEKLLIRSLIELGREKGLPSKISIGIINSKYNTMANELDVIEREGVELSLPVIRGFLEDLRFEERQLYSESKKIDLIFAKIDVLCGKGFETPITRSGKEASAVIEAIKNGLAYVNPFVSSFLIDNKSTLAFLQSPFVAQIVSENERKLIEKIIPVTRMLHSLKEHELKEVIDQKDLWVLKRSLDTRGRSVCIGYFESRAKWIHRLLDAFKASENYVIQEYEAPEQTTVFGETNFTSHAYFLLRGKPCGAFTRVSKSPITNVGKCGAVQVPLIAYPATKLF